MADSMYMYQVHVEIKGINRAWLQLILTVQATGYREPSQLKQALKVLFNDKIASVVRIEKIE